MISPISLRSLSRRADAVIWSMFRAGVSSMNSGAPPRSSSHALVSWFISRYARPIPVLSLWPSTRDRAQRSRSAISRPPISRLTNRTEVLPSIAAWSQMFSAIAVFPMLGRAARIDELARLEAAGDVVQVDEPRRDPGDRVPAGLRPLGDPVHRLREDVLELVRVALDLLLGDGEDLPLGRFQQLLRGELIGIAVADDLGGAVDQLAADRLLAHDLGIVLGVGRVRDAVDDLAQRLVAADLLELVAPDQLVGQRDGVDPLAQVVQVADRLVDRLVRVPIEVRRPPASGTISCRTSLSSSMLPSTLRSASRFCGGRRSPSAVESGRDARPPPLPFGLPLPLPGPWYPAAMARQAPWLSPRSQARLAREPAPWSVGRSRRQLVPPHHPSPGRTLLFFPFGRYPPPIQDPARNRTDPPSVRVVSEHLYHRPPAVSTGNPTPESASSASHAERLRTIPTANVRRQFEIRSGSGLHPIVAALMAHQMPRPSGWTGRLLEPVQVQPAVSSVWVGTTQSLTSLSMSWPRWILME